MNIHRLLPRGENARALIGGGIYSLLLLFFLSPDSYLRDGTFRCDSAWFYTCGKAWMSGMVPYVDFTDCKGPLLWLIYGIGYLLNDHSYVGVFWMSIPFYTATLFFAYKLCRLFVGIKASAMAVSFLPFVLLNSYYHNEVRAEDFGYTFIMLAMYCMCYTLTHRAATQCTYLRLSLLMGVACMCCVLTKWNMAIMVMSLMAVVLWLALRNRTFGASLGGMAAGMAAAALPFVACFVVYGNLGDFIQEYFITTFEIVQRRSGLGTTGMSVIDNLVGTEKKLMVFLIAVVALFSWRYKTGGWLLFCLLCFRLVKGDHHSAYLFMPLLTFSVYFFITIAGWVNPDGRRWPRRVVVALCLLGVVLSIGYNVIAVNRRSADERRARQANYRVAYIMAQVENPKLLYREHDRGCGAWVNGLPACKYYANQGGFTDEMRQDRQQCLESGTADFVFIQESWEGYNKICWTREYAESCGYVFYAHYVTDANLAFSVFGRPGLQLPPDDFHVTQWDVWLKRDVFGR